MRHIRNLGYMFGFALVLTLFASAADRDAPAGAGALVYDFARMAAFFTAILFTVYGCFVLTKMLLMQLFAPENRK